MLTDRFPVLSLVPDAVRAELNLDGEQVAVSFTITRASAGQLRLRSTPVIDQRAIAQRLDGKRFPTMLPGVDYRVTVDERGEVTMMMGGRIVDGAEPIELLLRNAYNDLCVAAKGYTQDLQAFGNTSAESMTAAMGQNIHFRLQWLKDTGELHPRMFAARSLRARAYCVVCLAQGLGRPLIGEIDKGTGMIQLTIPCSPLVDQCIGRLIGETVGPDLFPVPVMADCHQQTCPGAIHRVMEASCQTVIQRHYRRILDEFLRYSVGSAGGPIEE